jgi:hypothetical protein
VNWVKFIDSVIVANRSFGFDIKTGIILVKCYNGIILVRLRIVIFSSVHLIYTNKHFWRCCRGTVVFLFAELTLSLA